MFKIGAALGRIVGEALHIYSPLGIRYGGRISQIIPGINTVSISKRGLQFDNDKNAMFIH